MAIVTRQVGELVYFVDEQIPVPHGFTTRLGGVSTGVYESLNLAQNLGDDPAHVLENYKRITAALGIKIEDLVFSHQIHEDRVRLVDATHRLDGTLRPADEEADGLVTADWDVALAVFMADCIPVLLWDADTGAVGAVHAGWRSAVMDIVGKAVRDMTALGARPEDIRAAIGPGIGPCCFETGPEVIAAVTAVLGDEASDLIQNIGNGKAMVNLKEVNHRLLLRAGLLPEHITVSELCTMCNPSLFWSHRAMDKVRGVQAAIISSRGTTE